MRLEVEKQLLNAGFRLIARNRGTHHYEELSSKGKLCVLFPDLTKWTITDTNRFIDSEINPETPCLVIINGTVEHEGTDYLFVSGPILSLPTLVEFNGDLATLPRTKHSLVRGGVKACLVQTSAGKELWCCGGRESDFTQSFEEADKVIVPEPETLSPLTPPSSTAYRIQKSNEVAAKIGHKKALEVLKLLNLEDEEATNRHLEILLPLCDNKSVQEAKMEYIEKLECANKEKLVNLTKMKTIDEEAKRSDSTIIRWRIVVLLLDYTRIQSLIAIKKARPWKITKRSETAADGYSRFLQATPGFGTFVYRCDEWSRRLPILKKPDDKVISEWCNNESTQRQSTNEVLQVQKKRDDFVEALSLDTKLCPSCKNRMIKNSVQLRRGDEAASIMFTCEACQIIVDDGERVLRV